MTSQAPALKEEYYQKMILFCTAVVSLAPSQHTDSGFTATDCVEFFVTMSAQVRIVPAPLSLRPVMQHDPDVNQDTVAYGWM